MTDQERKAMQMALEALESAANNEGNFHDYKYAANALRQALAQPEQESTQEHESRITGLEIRVAKLENPITDHEKILFIGLDSNGNVVAEDSEGWLIKYRNTGIFMAPKKRTVWVNLYKIFYTKENADAADTISDRQRIGGKAYPVEIEE